jgi:hypothetical protein
MFGEGAPHLFWLEITCSERVDHVWFFCFSFPFDKNSKGLTVEVEFFAFDFSFLDFDEEDSLSKPRQTSLGQLRAFVNLQVAMRIC